MMGTATSSLCPRSSVACPPRLKMPTLYPVLPRLRVGIPPTAGASFASAELAPVAPCARTNVGMVAAPSTAAPPTFRKLRRSEDFRDSDLRMDSFVSEAGRIAKSRRFYSSAKSLETRMAPEGRSHFASEVVRKKRLSLSQLSAGYRPRKFPARYLPACRQ